MCDFGYHRKFLASKTWEEKKNFFFEPQILYFQNSSYCL